MLYYFNKGKNATETQKKICVVYGEDAVTDWMCQKWFAKFHAGDFSLDNTPQLGRFVKVGSDQIQTLTENNQCSTMWEIANILKISKSIKLLVKMKNVTSTSLKKLNGLLANPVLLIFWGTNLHSYQQWKSVPFSQLPRQHLCLVIFIKAINNTCEMISHYCFDLHYYDD